MGLTYALGQNRGTVLKASYAHFVDALGTVTIGYTNPLGSSAGAYYPWNDVNDNNIVDVGEVDTTGHPLSQTTATSSGIRAASRFAQRDRPEHRRPARPTSSSAASIRRSRRASRSARPTPTASIINPVVGLPYDPTTGTIITNADYVQVATLTGTLPDGTPYGPEPVFGVNPALINALGGYPSGNFYTNRKDYNQVYSGFDFTLTKRLSNKWMARAAFSYGINDQHLTSPNGCPGEPNNGPLYGAPYGFFENAVQTTCRNDDYVSQQSQGSGSHYAVFLNSKYVYNINAMYQLPMNFNIAASFFGRQGYPINYYVEHARPRACTRSIRSRVPGRRPDPCDRGAAGQRGALPDVERARPAAGEGDSVRVDGVGHRRPRLFQRAQHGHDPAEAEQPHRLQRERGPRSSEPLGPAVVGARFLVVVIS